MAPPVVNLCVLRLPLKRAGETAFPFRQSSLDALGITSDDKTGLDAFFAELQERRDVLLRLLGNEEALEEDVDGALSVYFAHLNHLLVPMGSGEVPVRSGYSFVWNDALRSTQVVVYKSVEYEIVNMLLSTALWRCNQGALRMIYTEEGLSTSSASKAFLLYRKAIGMVEYCQRLLAESNSMPAERTDADPAVLTGLIHLFFAEIQGITVLRAMEKGNAPSLIASLALDAQNRYAQSAESVSNIMTGNYLHKIHAYASYKAACFKSYMLVYHSWAKLSASAGGAAVRLATEAEKICQEAANLGNLYDTTLPPTRNTERQTFQMSLDRTVTKVKKQAESDNRHVYYERVPTDLPELPTPKQLVGSIAFEFPTPSAIVNRDIFAGVKTSPAMESAGQTVIEIVPGTNKPLPQIDGIEQQTKKEPEQKQKSVWWRWLLVIIAVPLLLIVSLIGILVWIILIPIKIFCWPIGALAQFLWRVVEYLIKAPLRAMKWAAGEPWQPVQPEPRTATQAQP